MGRCNGGGGRRHGGGGYQEGQNKGTKTGKAGHGRSGAHDATSSKREEQKRDKLGQPLNHGPWRNGYWVGSGKPQTEAQSVSMAEEQLAALSLLTTQAAVPAAAQGASGSASAAASAPSAPSTQRRSARSHAAGSTQPTPRAADAQSEAQQRESERLLRAQTVLDGMASHEAMRATRASLPAAASRAAMLDAAESSQAVVVCGETGCGKSTQVPQFLLEAAVARGAGAQCTVLIAQPRRVAAISLAQRVAAERGEEVGGVVGYSIRHEAA